MATGHGFLFLSEAFGAEVEPVATAVGVAGLLFLSSRVAVSALRRSDSYVVQPETKLGLRNLFELVAEFIQRLGDNIMGVENRRFLPFVATIFVFVLALNLIGLVPGFSAPTDSVPFNLGLGITVFIVYNILGIRSHGLAAYIKHFGVVPIQGGLITCMLFAALWLFIAIVETISHLVRPISLSVRLFGNMTADHAVLQVFTELTEFGIPVPVLFYLLGTFVCFMQAFVFSVLSMIYIRLAVAHDGDHGDHEEHHS